MKLTLKDLNKVGKFTAIFQHLKQLVDCIGIYFDDNGLYIQGMQFADMFVEVNCIRVGLMSIVLMMETTSVFV